MWFQTWHWLVLHNFWQFVIAWCVGAVLTAVTGWLPWRKHRATQRTIADRLDSTTPGGITDLIQAVSGTQGGNGNEGDS